jgi:serine/threonine protein kinase
LFDNHQNAILTDFGIAKLAEGNHLTQEGDTIGTPAYMSPEQASGQIIDHRSDIYSMGVILYEMLTGTPPYNNDRGALSILMQHINDPVPRISDLLSMENEELDAIIYRAMAKDPNDRYQSADELKQDILNTFSTITATAPEPFKRLTQVEDSKTVIVNTTPSNQIPTIQPNKQPLSTQIINTAKRHSSPIGILGILPAHEVCVSPAHEEAHHAWQPGPPRPGDESGAASNQLDLPVQAFDGSRGGAGQTEGCEVFSAIIETPDVVPGDFRFERPPVTGVLQPVRSDQRQP